MTNLSEVIPDCPEFSKADVEFEEEFSYWVEGVWLIAVAVTGIVANTLGSVILCQRSMRNSFNLLLVALAVYDNTYLIGAILDSFRKPLGHLMTDVHVYMFPYFLYPLHMMAMTGSIVMTVAIALERYWAVHYPINYSQAMNDSRALRKRMIKYLVPVTVFSIVWNVTKFFEIDIIQIPIVDEDTGVALNMTR